METVQVQHMLAVLADLYLGYIASYLAMQGKDRFIIPYRKQTLPNRIVIDYTLNLNLHVDSDDLMTLIDVSAVCCVLPLWCYIQVKMVGILSIQEILSILGLNILRKPGLNIAPNLTDISLQFAICHVQQCIHYWS